MGFAFFQVSATVITIKFHNKSQDVQIKYNPVDSFTHFFSDRRGMTHKPAGLSALIAPGGASTASDQPAAAEKGIAFSDPLW
jgi:hypothetical protein